MTTLAAIVLTILGACRGPLADLRAESPAAYPSALPVCAEVAFKSMVAGVRPSLLTRRAFDESRFRRDVCSPRGACGPLQAIPRYWCPRVHPGWARGAACDLVAAGVEAKRYYLRKARGDEALAFCWYTGRRGCGG